MANKRMFALDVIDTDHFCEMPVSARLLYYELGMRGDDEGFVQNPKRIMLTTGTTVDDLKVLAAKGYVFWLSRTGSRITRSKMTAFVPHSASKRRHKSRPQLKKLTDFYCLEPVWNQSGTSLEPKWNPNVT